MMKKVTLGCGVHGEATVFPVEIALNAKVIALQEAIAAKYKIVSDRVAVYPASLTLYVAPKTTSESGEIKWLQDDQTAEDLLLHGAFDSSKYEEMRPMGNLDDYVGKNFTPLSKEIHVLVVLPARERSARGKAGETEAALAEEKRRYEDAKRRYDEAGQRMDETGRRLDEAGRRLDEAREALQQWKADHEEGFALSDPDLVELKQDVKDAGQYLRNANQWLRYACERLKDARAAAENARSARLSTITPAGVGMEKITLHEKFVDEFGAELEHYQAQGQQIRENCIAFCSRVVAKINELYLLKMQVLPFVCVEGSSGMGKSQLAFALSGRRPYYYLLATPVGMDSQKIYKAFTSLSNTFHGMVARDDPSTKAENEVLNAISNFYNGQSQWTLGFIRSLLKHSSQESHQRERQMIRFDTRTTLEVAPCTAQTVREEIREMKAAGKNVPFFILDEMTLNSNIRGGKNMAAFQQNGFRVCELVVVIMGTDSQVTNVAAPCAQSRSEPHHWLSLVPRFPPYQVRVPLVDDHAAWGRVVDRYPLVKHIADHSRGLFARLFVRKIVECERRDGAISLADLLDEACSYVRERTYSSKPFLAKVGGKRAQVVAMSYTDSVDTAADAGDLQQQPATKRQRLEAGATSMHLHFANLIDDVVTDIDLGHGKLWSARGAWEPKCSFPAIDQDLLLYLAILGAKTSSSFQDHATRQTYSTKSVVGMTKELSVDENTTHAVVSQDGKRFENMVALALVSASRRNGVQGIPFGAFFQSLVGEFQDGKWSQVTLQGENGEEMAPRELFTGYVDQVRAVATRTIPFLAPTNGEWPASILEANASGCTFGHLVRGYQSKDRCDVYVRDVAVDKPIFVCECKHYANTVGITVMRGIVSGLNVDGKKPGPSLSCSVHNLPTKLTSSSGRSNRLGVSGSRGRRW